MQEKSQIFCLEVTLEKEKRKRKEAKEYKFRMWILQVFYRCFTLALTVG